MVENSPLRLQGIRLRARVLFHSTVISAAERESAYVIDGLGTKKACSTGLRIYHNPFARHPLEPALFRHRSVFQWYFEGKEMFVETA